MNRAPKTFANTKGDIPVGHVQAADLLAQYAPVSASIVNVSPSATEFTLPR